MQAFYLVLLVEFALIGYNVYMWVESFKYVLKIGLLEKLRIHHSVYRLPCTSEYLEELVSDILNENDFVNDWKPNRSHSVSVDMTTEDGVSISVKSGVYDPKKNILKFSGSRLGKYNTTEERIQHVMDTSADVYVCLAKADQDWSSVPEKFDTKTYYLFVFDKSCLDYNSAIWYDKENIACLDAIGLSAYISPSMSYQLWTKVDTAIVGIPEKLDILGI
jgi:hypothetical protein